MEIFKGIKAFIAENRKEKWFKYVTVIVVLVIIAIAVNGWRNYEDRKENPEAAQAEQQEQDEERNFLLEMVDESKAHIVVLSGLMIATWTVRIKNADKLKEKNGGRK